MNRTNYGMHCDNSMYALITSTHQSPTLPTLPSPCLTRPLPSLPYSLFYLRPSLYLFVFHSAHVREHMWYHFSVSGLFCLMWCPRPILSVCKSHGFAFLYDGIILHCLYVYMIPWYKIYTYMHMYSIYFMHSSVDAPLGWSHISAIVSSATIKVSLVYWPHFLWVRTQDWESWITGTGSSSLTFGGNIHTAFLTGCANVYPPLGVGKCSLFSTSLPAILNNGHSTWSEI
jgi:hypothetical protein